MTRLAAQRLCFKASALSIPCRTAVRSRFASPFTRTYATKAAFSKEDLATLKINGTRLMDTLHSTCEIGKAHRYGDAPTETGMARLTLNDDDAKIRNWLIEEVKSLGCTVTVDKIGNMFAVRPGLNNDKPPIMMGSHFDTQPTGGRYDGILGMTAALEVLRTLNEADIQTRSPIGLINWTNEEGARFASTTMGSSVWAETVPLEKAWAMEEVPSLAQGSEYKTVKQELERTGFLGDVEASYKAQPIAAHFELHIEQGPILENEGLKIGVVKGGQAYRWYEFEVKGKDSHAGTTPMDARTDAMVAAAEIILAATKLAKDYGGLATVGILRTEPGSINTIAHTVKFTLDIRNESNENLKKMFQHLKRKLDRKIEQKKMNVKVHIRNLIKIPAVHFDRNCIDAVEKSAMSALAGADKEDSSKKLWKRMISGAGHDSCAVSRRVPAAMIFTPTKDGLSHTPTEYCSPEDCELGAQVLLGAVLRYDLMGPKSKAKEAKEAKEAVVEKSEEKTEDA